MNQWNDFFKEEKKKDYFLKLEKAVCERRQKEIVHPNFKDVYKAFEETPFSDIKVVLLGQDPYHGENQATGLSFSLPKEMKLPASLRNVFKELVLDIQCPFPENGDLTKWARSGVFLLNTSLTVGHKSPASHSRLGWQKLTDSAIKFINDNKKGVVFILWGKHAQQKKKLIDESHHSIIESPHPSPFSAHRGFFGSKPFSKANRELEKMGVDKVDWTL